MRPRFLTGLFLLHFSHSGAHSFSHIASARSRIGLSALAPNRQSAHMPHSAIRANVAESLNIERNLAAELAFNFIILFYYLAQAADFILRYIFCYSVWRNFRLI